MYNASASATSHATGAASPPKVCTTAPVQYMVPR